MPSDRTRNTLARQAQAAPATTDGRPTPEAFPSLLEKHGAALARALPNGISPERFSRIVLTEFRTTKNLDRCAPMTIFTCAVTAARLGLEPGGPLGLSYLIPRWSNARRVYECTLQIGYRGYVNLARRSGELVEISADKVCAEDEFDFSYGFPNHLLHKPATKTARGAAWAYYCKAMFTDGGRHLLVMGRPEVEEHRDRYAPRDKDQRISGPWVDNFDEMAAKTTVRLSAKFLPVAAESPLVQGVAADGRSFASVIHPDQLADEPALILPDDTDTDDGEVVPDAAADAGVAGEGGPATDPPAVAGPADHTEQQGTLA